MPRPVVLFVFLLLTPLLAAGCGLLGDDEDEPSTSSIRVLQASMSTEITEESQVAGTVTRAFPEGTRQVFAVLVFRGVEAGAEVTGRWYQLSLENVAPEGHFVSEGSVTLAQEHLDADQTARVSLNLVSGSDLPRGDWVVRVYVDGEFVRTMGFVISPLVTLDGQSQGGAPEPTPEASPPPENPVPTVPPEPEATAAPETYTVQSGDTLTIIAEQFKPANESTDDYVARILELNNLAPGSILFVGQVLQLPSPNP